MSSKRAYYFHKKFNWKEIINLFAYDVKMPERLSKRQQILRLYKNCSRRLFEIEMQGVQACDIHSFAHKMQELRKDFENMKTAKTDAEVNNLLEKYEQFIEFTYTEIPWTHDNVSYEWRHGKGMPIFSKEEIGTDYWGYYDKKLLSYYPQPLEWQFRDEYPADDAINFQEQFSPNEWDKVNENDNVLNQSGQSPDQFSKEVEELKAKYQLNKPNLWENTQAKH